MWLRWAPRTPETLRDGVDKHGICPPSLALRHSKRLNLTNRICVAWTLRVQSGIVMSVDYYHCQIDTRQL